MDKTAIAFFIHLLLWAGGSSGLVLAVLLARRREHPLIGHYAWATGLWSLNQLSLLAFVYLNDLAGLRRLGLNQILNDFGYLTLGAFLYAVSGLVFRLFQVQIKPVWRRLIVLASAVVALPFIWPAAHWPALARLGWLEMVKVAALYIVLYVLAFYYKRQIARVEEAALRATLNRLFWLQMVFFPLMLAEGAVFYQGRYPFILSPATLFFFVLNLAWLRHASRYIHLPELRLSDRADRLSVFARIYAITPRERDVTARLLQGQSYQQIADALFISHETVKSHVNNVYRKAGVSSKMALADLIQRCES